MIRCPNCNAPQDDDTMYCGNCGYQLAPVYAQGATMNEATELISVDNSKTVLSDSQSYPGGYQAASIASSAPVPPASTGRSSTPPYPAAPPPVAPTPPGPSRAAGGNRRVLLIASVLLVILVVVVSAGLFTLLKKNTGTTATNTTNTGGGAAVTTSGTVLFNDATNGQGNTNSLKIVINGLANSPSGSHYNAWLIDDATEHTLALGTLQGDTKAFTLNFSDPHTNLIGAGNKLIITQEQSTTNLPTGKVVLSGTFPPLAFIHIRHLLFQFGSTPHNVGLLVGLRDTAQQLNSQVLILQGMLAAGDQNAISCQLQNIINLEEGPNGAHYHPLTGANQWTPCVQAPSVTQAGDGFGLANYNDLAAQHASLAATQADSTPLIKTHAGHVIIATQNIKGWLNTFDQDAVNFRRTTTNTSLMQPLLKLANEIYNGIDTNNDESVDPVPGEAGAIVAYAHGQLMATLTLKPA